MTLETSAPALPRRRRPNRRETMQGIALMLGAFFCYALADLLAKLLTQSFNPSQVAWIRQLGLLAGALTLFALQGRQILRSRHPVLQACRGLTVVAASTSFVVAIAFVPLADAIAVSFLAPFVVTALAALVLKETVGLRRWIAVALGFAGTMVIIRPGFGTFHPAIFLVLVSAGAFAIRQVISRFVSGTDPLTTTVAYTAITAVTVLAIPLPFVWRTPGDPSEFLLMFGMACAAGCGELMVMRALELAEAVVLSPLQYTLMIWGTIWGFLVFAQLPDGWTIAGTAIVVASGIYSLYREARAAD